MNAAQTTAFDVKRDYLYAGGGWSQHREVLAAVPGAAREPMYGG